MEINNQQVQVESQQLYSINVDRTKRQNLFSPPFCASLYANSRGGKSTTIINILLDDRYKLLTEYFLPQNIYICSPTCRYDDTYQRLFDRLQQFPQFDIDKQVVEDPLKMPDFIKNVINKNKELKKQKIYQYVLFLIDDCYGELKMDNNSIINNIAVKGRHNLISMFLTTQSHKGIGNSIRRNSTHNFMWNFDNGQEIDSICSEMRGTMSNKQFKEIYLQAVNSESNAFLFHCKLMPPQLKFSINLKDIIVLPQ